MTDKHSQAQVLVLGGGPGGYPAAFLAADLGMDVTLVDAKPNPGGICLFEGCIPSKTLLHAAKLINETAAAKKMGLTFQPPQLDLDQLRSFKNGVVDKLTGGLGVLKARRKVNFVRGHGTIESPHTVMVVLQEGGREIIEFESLIIATGSAPAAPAVCRLHESPRVGFDGRAGTAGDPPAVARHWRRLHRHGIGHRLRCARLASHRGRSRSNRSSPPRIPIWSRPCSTPPRNGSTTCWWTRKSRRSSSSPMACM